MTTPEIKEAVLPAEIPHYGIANVSKDQFIKILTQMFGLSDEETRQVDLVVTEKGMNIVLSELCDALAAAGFDALSQKLAVFTKPTEIGSALTKPKRIVMDEAWYLLNRDTYKGVTK